MKLINHAHVVELLHCFSSLSFRVKNKQAFPMPSFFIFPSRCLRVSPRSFSCGFFVSLLRKVKHNSNLRAWSWEKLIRFVIYYSRNYVWLSDLSDELFMSPVLRSGGTLSFPEVTTNKAPFRCCFIIFPRFDTHICLSSQEGFYGANITPCFVVTTMTRQRQQQKRNRKMRDKFPSSSFCSSCLEGIGDCCCRFSTTWMINQQLTFAWDVHIQIQAVFRVIGQHGFHPTELG